MLYREWFVHFRYPGHEQMEMAQSVIGQIPKTWEVKRLGEVAGVNKRSIKKREGPVEIHYIDIASVSTGHIDKAEWMPYADAPGRARRIVQHGDIIWSTVRPNRKSYSLIINPLANSIVSTGFAVISAIDVPFSYLYLAVTTDDFADYLTNHATGSAYPAVSASDFENARILCPPRELLKLFHKITFGLFVQQENLRQRNANLRRTHDLVLPKLISGELDVEHLDITTNQSL